MIVDLNILDGIINVCKRCGVKEVILFGSRAKGTAVKTSDYDIAVSGVRDICELEDALEDIDTLYKIDIVDLDSCLNNYLLEDIKTYGVKIL